MLRSSMKPSKKARHSHSDSRGSLVSPFPSGSKMTAAAATATSDVLEAAAVEATTTTTTLAVAVAAVNNGKFHAMTAARHSMLSPLELLPHQASSTNSVTPVPPSSSSTFTPLAASFAVPTTTTTALSVVTRSSTKSSISSSKPTRVDGGANMDILAALASNKQEELQRQKPNPVESTYFPVVLHCMLAQAPPDVMYWHENGKSFFIDAAAPNLATALLAFFKHGNYQSLRRQMNCYGFQKKAKADECKGFWMHSSGAFCRDSSVEMLASIKNRYTKKGEKAATLAQGGGASVPHSGGTIGTRKSTRKKSAPPLLRDAIEAVKPWAPKKEPRIPKRTTTAAETAIAEQPAINTMEVATTPSPSILATSMAASKPAVDDDWCDFSPSLLYRGDSMQLETIGEETALNTLASLRFDDRLYFEEEQQKHLFSPLVNPSEKTEILNSARKNKNNSSPSAKIKTPSPNSIKMEVYGGKILLPSPVTFPKDVKDQEEEELEDYEHVFDYPSPGLLLHSPSDYPNELVLAPQQPSTPVKNSVTSAFSSPAVSLSCLKMSPTTFLASHQTPVHHAAATSSSTGDISPVALSAMKSYPSTLFLSSADEECMPENNVVAL